MRPNKTQMLLNRHFGEGTVEDTYTDSVHQHSECSGEKTMDRDLLLIPSIAKCPTNSAMRVKGIIAALTHQDKGFARCVELHCRRIGSFRQRIDLYAIAEHGGCGIGLPIEQETTQDYENGGDERRL